MTLTPMPFLPHSFASYVAGSVPTELILAGDTFEFLQVRLPDLERLRVVGRRRQRSGWAQFWQLIPSQSRPCGSFSTSRAIS